GIGKPDFGSENGRVFFKEYRVQHIWPIQYGGVNHPLFFGSGIDNFMVYGAVEESVIVQAVLNEFADGLRPYFADEHRRFSEFILQPELQTFLFFGFFYLKMDPQCRTQTEYLPVGFWFNYFVNFIPQFRFLINFMTGFKLHL